MAIVDTSTVVDVGKNNRHAIDAVRKVGESGEPLCLSTISIFELSSGKPPGISSSRKQLVDSMRVLPLQQKYAEEAGKIYRELMDAGLEIGVADCMIAATAICEKQALITANAKHFARISGLEVISY